MKISATKISNNILIFIIICAVFTIADKSVKASDDSVEDIKAVLVQLAKLSKTNELQTDAAQKLLADEMLELEISTFGNLTEMPDKILMLEKNRAIGRFQLFGENDQITDVYFYLQNNNGWKVNAVRLLSLTGIIERIYLGLKAKPNLTAEEKYLFENSKLTLASDKELQQWFLKNESSLNKISFLLKNAGKYTTVNAERNSKQFPEVRKLLKKLNLGTVNVEENGSIKFVIGGITDNTVGFIYTNKQPPEISPSFYIWIEEVSPKWYLFRTT